MARLNIRPASRPIIAAAISCFTTTQHIEAPGNCLDLQASPQQHADSSPIFAHSWCNFQDFDTVKTHLLHFSSINPL